MLVMLAALEGLAGCPSGNGELGERCDGTSDCGGELQCLSGVCIARCQRAPECGDGYACDSGGICHLATGQLGDACTAEVACAPGLSCQIDGATGGHLLASCTEQHAGHPAGSECELDADCRNGTCALGHCTDLCDDTRDCGTGLACMGIPRIDPDAMADGLMFSGCLPSRGTLAWTIPIRAPTQTFHLPIPDAATAVSIAFSVDDSNQVVGATHIVSPSGATLLESCTDPVVVCDPIAKRFGSAVRHRPELAQSVLAMPSSPATLLEPGAYAVTVSSLRANDNSPGSAIPRVTAVVKLDASVILDLHFYFLDLDEHSCSSELGSPAFDAGVARSASAFQVDFLGELRGIFAHGGLAIGSLSYEDIKNHPDLDGLDISDGPSLLALGHYPGGINVFFVRTLSPVGIQALGPNPGPAGLAGTRQSGIVVGVDTLCYRSWTQLARLTAHEIARYMGLYHNVEVDTDATSQTLRDPILDSDDSSANLMFYSEFGSTELSAGQREILTRSPVLR